MENNLKKFRTDENLTQERLCKELQKYDCYMCRTTYAKYESGKRNIPCDVLVKLAVFFRTSCDSILGVEVSGDL